MNANPKIAVVGAGAVGSLIGGLLARAGEDVTLIARRAHVEAIRANGLRIGGILGEITVPVNAAQALRFQPDLVLLAVKTQDVEAACLGIRAFLDHAPLVTLQNGVRSDEIAASVLPKENIVSGVVLLNAQFLQPGQVTYAQGKFLVIGEAFGENGRRVREIQALLDKAIPTRISDNIQGAHWTKLLVNNMANGIEAMTGMTVKECMRDPRLRRISLLALKEGYRAIEKAGIRLEPLPGLPLPLLSLMIHLPVPIAARILSLGAGASNTLSSTLQSLRRGLPTEIDYLNGEIVRLGRGIGMATPYNARVVEVVKEVEKSRRFYSAEELAGFFEKNLTQPGY